MPGGERVIYSIIENGDIWYVVFPQLLEKRQSLLGAYIADLAEVGDFYIFYSPPRQDSAKSRGDGVVVARPITPHRGAAKHENSHWPFSRMMLSLGLVPG